VSHAGHVPPRPPRDQRLDVVRGWLQASIFVSHIANSWVGAWLIHRPYGLSDSSEMFVFLSGFMLGSVFTRKQARDGWRAAAIDLLARTWRLYRIHLTVCAGFLLMLAASSLLLVPGELRRLGWSYLLDTPTHALPHLLVMIYEPDWMDILPVFIWCMLALPLYAALERRVGGWALIPSLAAYLATQTGWITSPSLTEEIGMGFDPFAWQLLFLGGAALGKRALLSGQALPFHASWRKAATSLAALVLLVGLYLKLCWFGVLPGPAPLPDAAWLTDKQELVWPRVVHAAAIAWLVAAHVPRDRGWMHLRPASWLAALGRHSLEVFCIGLFLSYVVSTAMRLNPAWAWLIDPVMAALGLGVLVLFAQRRDRARAPARPVRVTAEA
jgi:hypothetical protein